VQGGVLKFSEDCFKVTEMKNIKYALTAGFLAWLAACGGGGDGPLTPEATSPTYDLRAAYVAMLTTPSTLRFVASGTLDGIGITGLGTTTSGAVTSDTFEGQPALQRSETISGTLNGNGQTFPLNVTSTDWTDSDHVPIIAKAVRANDSGNLFTANTFQDSSKNLQVGTVVASYMVQPDTPSTAIVKLVRTYRDNQSVITRIATKTFRIGQTNRLAPLSETLESPASQTNLTLNYRGFCQAESSTGCATN
jgi:hypothetical protein